MTRDIRALLSCKAALLEEVGAILQSAHAEHLEVAVPPVLSGGSLVPMNSEALEARGWRLIERVTDAAPQFEVWRLGREPFCVELELWGSEGNREIRGRLAAPGLQVTGNMVIGNLPSIPDAVGFLERLLQGATYALQPNGVDVPSQS